MKIFAVAVAACSVVTSTALSINRSPVFFNSNGNVNMAQDPLTRELTDVYIKYHSHAREIYSAYQNLTIPLFDANEDISAIADSFGTSLDDIQQMLKKSNALAEQFDSLSRIFEAKYS